MGVLLSPAHRRRRRRSGSPVISSPYGRRRPSRGSVGRGYVPLAVCRPSFTILCRIKVSVCLALNPTPVSFSRLSFSLSFIPLPLRLCTRLAISPSFSGAILSPFLINCLLSPLFFSLPSVLHYLFLSLLPPSSIRLPLSLLPLYVICFSFSFLLFIIIPLFLLLLPLCITFISLLTPSSIISLIRPSILYYFSLLPLSPIRLSYPPPLSPSLSHTRPHMIRQP